MVFEKSCGALVVRREEDNYYILMIRHKAGGNRSFPKGHVEEGETEYETALREVMEETSSRIAIVSDFRATVNYRPSPGVMKEVVYFLAFTTNADIKAREGEIAEVEWVPLSKAEHYLAHENDKTVFRAAMERMQRMTVEIK
ncbi:MAG: NUDIX domain-containing protein [Ruminococcaceae bacterium]|nr:NUDIX domain-containing protein [Oscillospiraceae bacterium]